MPPPHNRVIARHAAGPGDLAAIQALRAAAFGLDAPDLDPLDDACIQIVIEDRRNARLVGCLRLLPLASGTAIARSYSARFYDLSRLAHCPTPMAELGRFCIHPAARDPDILRAAWAAVTAHVDATGAHMLFGCTSFRGTDPAAYEDAFGLLARRHLAPTGWAPKRRAPQMLPLEQGRAAPDVRRGLRQMPPLLRSYLAMGGKVGDHAVIDTQMNTLHVFTGLDIAAIPAARKRLLRADARAQRGGA